MLDEATSALEAKTEPAVSRIVAELAGEVPTDIDAYRLSTVRNADVFAFLDDGRIAGIGGIDEVRNAVPAFARQPSLLGIK